jgi:hypothetical protein
MRRDSVSILFRHVVRFGSMSAISLALRAIMIAKRISTTRNM